MSKHFRIKTKLPEAHDENAKNITILAFMVEALATLLVEKGVLGENECNDKLEALLKEKFPKEEPSRILIPN